MKHSIGTAKIRKNEGDCEYLPRCSLFKTYEKHPQLALMCIGFKKAFCQGSKKFECKRRLELKKTGRMPAAEILPNGNKLVQSK